MDLSPSEPDHGPCDRPTRYVRITLSDGAPFDVPLFFACDPNVSQRDLGDPPPDKIDEQRARISNPAPVQR